MHSSLSSDDMCTKSVVRFRFSLKDNCETLETLDLNLSDSSIETQSKYLSTICSIRSTIGVKPHNQLNTENLNMNKGLQNGHQLNDKSFIDHNLDINSITTTTSSSSTSSVVSTCIDNIGTSCEPTMGLSNATSKDSLTQHLLLNSLKSGKPENGQRIDLSTISWTDLKHNSNKAMDSATHSPQIETISESQTLDNNCLAQNSPLTDQTVDQMIEEVLNKSDSQVREELTSQSILENNTNDEQQPQHQCSSGHPIDHMNGTKSDGLLECGPNLDTVVGLEAIDATEEHMSLVRQTERLMRRIRRLQFRQTHKHLTQQMKAFVKNQQNVLSIGCQRQPEPNTPSVTQLQSHSNPVEDRMKLLTPEGVKGLSTSALVNLVKRLGSTTTPNNESNHLRDYYAQQTPNRPQLQTPSITSSPQSSTLLPQVTQTPTTGSQLSQQLSNSSEKSSLVKLLQKSQSQSSSQPQQHTRVNTEDKDAILNTIDTLSTNLRHFESRFDSDATDSSSGGESCDELEDYSEDSVPQHSTPIQQTTGHLFPMRKRSCWKWCVERAAIASRWTWLQAQVADLEFRIRQQNEMYRQLRATKGSISFGTSDHNLMVPTPVVCKPNTLSTSVTTNGQPLQTQSQVTGDVSAPPQQPPPTHADSDSHYCMRTLPMNSMRKRKLVHSMSALSGATRKAAKYSTIQCSCNGLPDMMWPCVLCNGRYSYVHVIDTDSMPHFERVALLDSACHPVLSLNNDVSLGLHFTELLKRETIQRPIPSRHQNKKRRSPPSPTLSNKFLYDSSKPKSPKRSQSVISSSKLRKKYDGTAKRRYVRRSGSSSDGVWRKRGRPRERASSGSSRTESPIPSPVPSEGSTCGHSLSAPLLRRRRSEQHAFDINNIVIPYSIAATTRVEKLQYKEIITPKWRLTDPSEHNTFSFSDLKIKSESNEEIKAVPQKTTSIDDEDEDISDTAFTFRHIKSEEEERKRILSFIKGNTKSGSLRRGARVRFDSNRSDTTTTPGDTVFQNNDSTSQDSYNGTSIPSTPVVNNCNNEPNLAETPPPVPTERRRNASLSSRRDDSIDENFETVAPFELRTFPLNEIDFELMSTEVQPMCPTLGDDTLDSMNDPEKSNEGTITANNSRAPTPVDSDGAESVVEHNEGDNDNEDPEWEPKKLTKG